MNVHRLVREYENSGHPLGRPVYPSEIPDLLNGLLDRLKVSEDVLDSSLESLRRLDPILIKYAQSLQTDNVIPLDGDELIYFFRELTAYIANVLLTSANGEWDKESGGLYTTLVKIKGDWKSKKEGKITTPDVVIFVPGGEAVLAWDNILHGEKPKLSRIAVDIKRKYIRDG